MKNVILDKIAKKLIETNEELTGIELEHLYDYAHNLIDNMDITAFFLEHYNKE